jgi:outer membrane protein OmpA-like peptidoglycan-associated protein
MWTAGSSYVASRGRRYAGIGLAAAVCLGLGVSGPVRAQMPGEEPGAPSSTFSIGKPHNGFSIVEPPAGVPETGGQNTDEGSGRWFFQRWDQAPQADSSDSLYDEAMQALDAGRTADAQRLFERFIASSPRSNKAATARQHLGRLYSTVETGATPRAPDARTSSLPGIARPPSLGSVLRARAPASLDGLFLADAGDRVFFSVGSAELGTRARGVIQAQARFLKQRPELSAAVEGHADDGGLPDDAMVDLSEQRAAVVRDRLIAEGIGVDRILAYGRGREMRVSDCPQPECAAQNRRAVTILLSRRIVESSVVRRAEGDQFGRPSPTP